ncbi:MAG: alpha/beta hydrolase [Actinomycetota bacterium]
MTTFVLVPGAWLPGTVFDAVQAALHAHGHTTVAVTLPGIGDPTRRDVTLADWVAHVVDITLAAADDSTGGVVLAGHSYAGCVAGPAAVELADRIDHLVLIDSNVPRPGSSFADSWSPAGQAWLADHIRHNDGVWPPDIDQAATGLADDAQHRLAELASPMPTEPLYAVASDPALPTSVPTTYIHCTRARTSLPSDVTDPAAQLGWTITELDATHWPMLCSPDPLARLLMDCGAASSPP